MSLRVGWFSTGKDKQALFLLKQTCKAIKEKELEDVRINFLFCNREKGESRKTDRFIAEVEKMGIPLVVFSSRKFNPEVRKKALEYAKEEKYSLLENWRMLYDEEIIKRIEKYHFDLILLAGYMLVVGEKLCHRHILLNLHPALPGGPKGSWQEVIWELIRQKAKKTGIMIHKVTPQLDAGPAVTFCEFPITGAGFDDLWQGLERKLKKKTLEEIIKKEGVKEPLFSAIRKEQKKREAPLIIYTLKLVAEGKVNPRIIKKPVLLEI